MTETAVNLPAVAPQRREIQNVVDAVPILDTARFEHMQRIAAVLARSSMIPETLRTIGRGNDKEDLPFEQVLSNCFLVVNQAARWGMDPFSVISCCAVVHGRLAYEGKLVAAVLAAKLDISLNHYFTGDPATDAYRIYLCDQPFTEPLIAQLKPGVKIPGLRLWDGSVGEWKTTGAGTPWTPKNYPRMLIYRGTRDWTRIYESAILLGVYTDDELADLTEDARARRAIPVASSLAERLAAARLPGTTSMEGFSHDHVERETRGGVVDQTEAQRDSALTDKPTGPTAPKASEREPSTDDSGEVQDRMDVSTSPPNSNSVEPDAPQAQAQPDAPAADQPPLPSAAGNPSQSSAPHPVDEEAQTSEASPAGLPSDLSPDWQDTYLRAMARVTDRPKSLTGRHAEALQLIGGKANADEQAWMKAVYRLTERRLRGEITKDECEAAIREIS